MKKIWILLLMLSACILPASAATPPEVSAKACILVHPDTGTVLYEKNADAQMLIASTTKIMTALVAVETCDLDAEVTIRPEWAAVEGSSMYLKAGQTYTLRELLYGMMLASGNDAATAVACYVAGDTDSFAARMNEKAEALGLTHTSFENPHGLDGEDHYSTARDMARLAAYAMENEALAEIVGTQSVSIHGLTYVNHNKLLRMYPGVTGVKTGFTKAAGRTLVSACERDDTRYVCVTLNAPDDWDDHQRLYDWAYGSYSYDAVFSSDTSIELPIVCADGGSVVVSPEEDLRVLTRLGDRVEQRVCLPRFVFPGVSAGEIAGTVELCVNGELQARGALVYTVDVPLPEADTHLPNWLTRRFGGIFRK